MKKWVFIALLSVSSVSNAAFFTGNDLYTKYQSYERITNGTGSSDDYGNASEYMGYVTAIWDMLESNQICTSNVITRGQINDIIGQGLQNNPQMRGQNANQLVTYYLTKAFPC